MIVLADSSTYKLRPPSPRFRGERERFDADMFRVELNMRFETVIITIRHNRQAFPSAQAKCVVCKTSPSLATYSSIGRVRIKWDACFRVVVMFRQNASLDRFTRFNTSRKVQLVRRTICHTNIRPRDAIPPRCWLLVEKKDCPSLFRSRHPFVMV